jgi:F0F1-type ATP synthase assembly protein I
VAAPLLGLGTTLAVTVLAGFGAGYWLDLRLGTRPILLLLGSGIGIAVAMYHFVRSVTGATRDQTDGKQ